MRLGRGPGPGDRAAERQHQSSQSCDGAARAASCCFTLTALCSVVETQEPQPGGAARGARGNLCVWTLPCSSQTRRGQKTTSVSSPHP